MSENHDDMVDATAYLIQSMAPKPRIKFYHPEDVKIYIGGVLLEPDPFVAFSYEPERERPRHPASPDFIDVEGEDITRPRLASIKGHLSYQIVVDDPIRWPEKDTLEVLEDLFETISSGYNGVDKAFAPDPPILDEPPERRRREDLQRSKISRADMRRLARRPR